MKNTYEVKEKNCDTYTTHNYKEAVKRAKISCGWNYPVSVIKNGQLIHRFLEGYNCYIYDTEEN